jgi:hypothetical protein
MMMDAVEVLALSFLGPAVTCEWDLSPENEASLTVCVMIGMAIGASFWVRVCVRD